MKPFVRLVARFTAVLFMASGLAYVTLSPLYEVGDWKVIVPILGALDFLWAHAIFFNKSWFRRWARPLAIGSLLVAVPFWGQSESAYGDLEAPMLLAESTFILACVLLLWLTFAGGFLTCTRQQA